MKFFLRLPAFFLFTGVLIFPQLANSAYQMAPSTGNDLPYSVQTRNSLKHLFNNRTVIGGQVIALKDSVGKNFSGNYLDIGGLGGVKKDDVFALFTPQGEPVGFAHVTETQHYTSVFEFMELTVDPSNRLIAKKVTEEVRRRLPRKLFNSPDIGNWKPNTRLAISKKKTLASPEVVVSGTASSQGALPPLPSDSTLAASSGSNLPPLPSNNTSGSGNALPPLPGNGIAAADNSGLAPLPMNDSVSPSGNLPPLSTDTNAGTNPPALTSDTAGALPPLGSDTGSSSLPVLPSDNSSVQPPLPAPSNFMGTTPLPDVSMPPMSLTVAPDSGLPALPSTGDTTTVPSLPGGDSSNTLPALPGNDNQASLPPLGASDAGVPPIIGTDSTLPSLPPSSSAGPTTLKAPATAPTDISLPPLPSDTPSNKGMLMLPPHSSLPLNSSNSMASVNGLPSDVPVAPSSLDNNSISAPPDMSLPPVTEAALPGQLPSTSAVSSTQGLPPMDINNTLPALTDPPLPPASDNSLPGLPPTNLAASEMPPMAVASLPSDGNQIPLPTMNSSPNGLPDISAELPGTSNQAGLPSALNAPIMEDLSPPAIIPGATTPGSTASHSTNLGLPGVPADVKNSFLQDIPTLSPVKKPAA